MSAPIRSLVAYGDCNTAGVAECRGRAYPELVGEALGCRVENLGHTMSTTRELLQYARTHPPADFDLVLIQYGLVDSWLTFRRAPYVLYYPDNPRRRLLRKLVKKLKKIGRALNLKQVLGPAHVVPPDEYRRNLAEVIGLAEGRTVVLVGTPPNLDEPRNPHIRAFNQILQRLAAEHPGVLFVDPYPHIDVRRHEAFDADGTHLNAAGQRVVADLIVEALHAR
jgi:lysophospholipase L1-like esterase